jgi:hypothetical protein
VTINPAASGLGNITITFSGAGTFADAANDVICLEIAQTGNNAGAVTKNPLVASN